MVGRKILHIDMDAFFASVEQREHPEWRGKPVIVGGKSIQRGVVSTCSYEARQYGVHSAMPVKEALALCPQAILASSNFELYRKVSRQVREIFYKYTDLVEPLSIDEAYLDVTENKLNIGSATIVAKCIKEEIFQVTGLTCSVGVSFNKFLAKVASGFEKPAGITVVDYERFPNFIAELPIEDFYGVGKVSAQKLKESGIKTGKDLLDLELVDLTRKFGKQGYILYHQVRGKSNDILVLNRKRKSISKERTFLSDTDDEQKLIGALENFSKEIAEELQMKQLVGKSVSLKIRDKSFQTMNRSHSLTYYFNDQNTIFTEVIDLFEKIYRQEDIRLIGVNIGLLEEATSAYQQLSLFD
ncbi:DNA polymerase IV [Granulicatella seriolae]|uniref:DNA polymerase IV n=1 Tax=Granulicatella seriolae TaxID=2967226 RepID=A0ABT1WL33_9LACT|nr:DNA polymerase IV [Granulicatella seriolae]